MKRILFAIALLCLGAAIGAQSIDLIVMVDTSESMFGVFPDLVGFLLEDLLTERVRFGDTFHLLTFADTPETEVSLRVDSREAIEAVLRRLLLLKALGSYTDLVAALQYLAAYARQLPEGNRKTIVLLTDGIHDPPPGSPFRLDPEEVRARLFQTAQEIARAGWTVSILRLPREGETSASRTAETRAPADTTERGRPAAEPAGVEPAGQTMVVEQIAPAGQGELPHADVSAPEATGSSPRGTDYLDTISRAMRAPVADMGTISDGAEIPAAVGFPTLIFPAGVVRGGKRLPVTFRIHSGSPEAVFIELDSVRGADGTELLSDPVTAVVPPGGTRSLRATLSLPDGTQPGRQSLAVVLSFAGGVRVSPSSGVVEIEYTGRPGVVGGALSRVARGGTLLAVLGILIGVGLLTLIVLGMRGRIDLSTWATRSAGRTHAREVRTRAGLHPLVEMVVTMQNHHIGLRNVHSIPPGGSRTVGGGRSAYLIYFVPVPADIGYLTYDGAIHTFVPTQKDLFPEVGGQVPDCLGKEIPARSPRGYPITIVFRIYRSPLDEINEIMHSIRVEVAVPLSGDRRSSGV